MNFKAPRLGGLFFKVVEREDVREVKKEGLPRSFQSFVMTGMLVSLRGTK